MYSSVMKAERLSVCSVAQDDAEFAKTNHNVIRTVKNSRFILLSFVAYAL